MEKWIQNMIGTVTVDATGLAEYEAFERKMAISFLETILRDTER